MLVNPYYFQDLMKVLPLCLLKTPPNDDEPSEYSPRIPRSDKSLRYRHSQYQAALRPLTYAILGFVIVFLLVLETGLIAFITK
jgi:hypothetical protein